MKDCLPVQKSFLLPHNTWRELLDHREKAMAKRHILGWEQWSRHAKKLPPLVEGDSVFLQNLMGNHPRRWDRTGKVIEVKEHDQYLIAVDGSGRTTLRNRKHLRRFKPVPRAPTMQSLPQARVTQEVSPAHDVLLEYRTTPPTRKSMVVQDSTTNEDVVPQFDDRIQSQEFSQSPQETQQSLPDTNDLHQQPRQTTNDQSFLQPNSSDTEPLIQRPARVRKQNVRLNPDEWDLSVITEFVNIVKQLKSGLRGEGQRREEGDK